MPKSKKQLDVAEAFSGELSRIREQLVYLRELVDESIKTMDEEHERSESLQSENEKLKDEKKKLQDELIRWRVGSPDFSKLTEENEKLRAERDRWKADVLAHTTSGAVMFSQVKEENEKLLAVISRLADWTHYRGAYLKPPGADSYGEGIRAAQDSVSGILRMASIREPPAPPKPTIEPSSGESR